jgi:hypothetical protein
LIISLPLSLTVSTNKKRCPADEYETFSGHVRLCLNKIPLTNNIIGSDSVHYWGVAVAIQRTTQQVLLPSLTVTPHPFMQRFETPGRHFLFSLQVPLHLYRNEVTCPRSDRQMSCEDFVSEVFTCTCFPKCVWAPFSFIVAAEHSPYLGNSFVYCCSGTFLIFGDLFCLLLQRNIPPYLSNPFRLLLQWNIRHIWAPVSFIIAVEQPPYLGYSFDYRCHRNIPHKWATPSLIVATERNMPLYLGSI